MAFRSRYSQAFSRMVQAPEVTVQPFVPGSVTKSAAILKGISVYAKALQDRDLARRQQDALDAEAAQSRYRDALANERVPYKGPSGQTYNVTPYQAATLDVRDEPKAATATKPPKRVKMLPAEAKALGIEPDENGTVDPDEARLAFQWYSRTHSRPSNRSGGPTNREVQASAHQKYMSIDAPLVDRHARILLNQDASGGPVMVNGQQSAYPEEARAAAAQHLGIDYEAWALHDPSRFPDGTQVNAYGVRKPVDNSKQRAAAAAWQQQALQSAVARFRTERIRQYADNALPDAPAAGEQAAPNFDAFEQQFMNALGAGGQ